MVYFEKYSPIAIALCLSLGLYINNPSFNNFNQLFDQLASNSLSVCGTLIGFFLTILTIIQTINTRRMNFLKDSGLFPRLLSYLNTTIVWHLVVISITMLLPIIRQITFLSEYSREGKSVIIFFIILSWTLSIRFTYLFINLLHDPTPAQTNNRLVQLD